jgi:hypothetical protein
MKHRELGVASCERECEREHAQERVDIWMIVSTNNKQCSSTSYWQRGIASHVVGVWHHMWLEYSKDPVVDPLPC